MEANGTTGPGICSRLEQFAYLSVSLGILTGLAMYGWGRGYSLNNLGIISPIFQLGSLVVVPYALVLLAFSFHRSLYARGLIVSASSIIVMLGVVELTLQLCDCTPEVSYTARLRYNEFLEQRELGTAVATAFITSVYISRRGNSLVDIGVEDEGRVIIRTDENGFRNPQGLYDGLDSFDVFLLGDSFTEGWGVQDGFTIADYLRRTTPYTVYNGGIGGVGLMHKLAVFIEFGLEKQPDNVVLIIPESLSLSRAFKERGKKQYFRYWRDYQGRDILANRAIKDQALMEKAEKILARSARDEWTVSGTSFVHTLVAKAHTEIRLVHLVRQSGLTEQLRTVLSRETKDETDYHWYLACHDIEARRTMMRDTVSWMDQRVDDYGGRLFLVYLPNSRYFKGPDWPECEHDMVVELSEELQVPLIDMIPVFSRSDDPTIWFSTAGRRGGHNNRDGYRLIAEHIADRIAASR